MSSFGSIMPTKLVLVCDHLTEGEFDYKPNLISSSYISRAFSELSSDLGQLFWLNCSKFWEQTDDFHDLGDLHIQDDQFKTQSSYNISSVLRPHAKFGVYKSSSIMNITLHPDSTHLNFLTSVTSEVSSHTPKSNQFIRFPRGYPCYASSNLDM